MNETANFRISFGIRKISQVIHLPLTRLVTNFRISIRHRKISQIINICYSLCMYKCIFI